MRLLYKRYSGERGYTPEQFVAAASEVAGIDLSDFLARALDSQQELDYQAALNYYGLELSDSESVAKEKKENLVSP